MALKFHKDKYFVKKVIFKTYYDKNKRIEVKLD